MHLNSLILFLIHAAVCGARSNQSSAYSYLAINPIARTEGDSGVVTRRRLELNWFGLDNGGEGVRVQLAQGGISITLSGRYLGLIFRSFSGPKLGMPFRRERWTKISGRFHDPFSEQYHR